MFLLVFCWWYDWRRNCSEISWFLGFASCIHCTSHFLFSTCITVEILTYLQVQWMCVCMCLHAWFHACVQTCDGAEIRKRPAFTHKWFIKDKANRPGEGQCILHAVKCEDTHKNTHRCRGTLTPRCVSVTLALTHSLYLTFFSKYLKRFRIC